MATIILCSLCHLLAESSPDICSIVAAFMELEAA
jgi:hypothetical protein